METHARFFLIGMFSLAVTAAMIVFVLWLGKLRLDREHQEYEVVFQESVTGLSVGGIVQYQGVQVGEVRKLALDPNDPREVRALIRVAAATPVKVDTQAQLSYTGLTGVAVVELFGGSPESPLLRETDPRPVPEIQAVPSPLSQLMTGGRGAMLSAEDVLSRISDVLDDKNVERVSNLLANLESISSSMVNDYPDLKAVIADARTLERRLDGAAQRADSVLLQMQQGLRTDDPDKNVFRQARIAIGDVRDAATAVERFSSAGERTINGVDDAARAELVATLQSLQQVSEHLVRITRRLDQASADYLPGAGALPVYSPSRQPP
jgi:phospholipid/cholesterol/gamma-HCH transport system substrate-binding protein